MLLLPKTPEPPGFSEHRNLGTEVGCQARVQQGMSRCEGHSMCDSIVLSWRSNDLKKLLITENIPNFQKSHLSVSEINSLPLCQKLVEKLDKRHFLKCSSGLGFWGISREKGWGYRAHTVLDSIIGESLQPPNSLGIRKFLAYLLSGFKEIGILRYFYVGRFIDYIFYKVQTLKRCLLFTTSLC